jgi:large conductance mechanosensitive channel
MQICNKSNKRRIKGMLSEFKKFALRGNMIDLAVGIIIGTAFSGIVNSLVNDIVMPVLSLLTNRIDFEDKFIALDGGKYATLAEAQAQGVATINYGLFVSGVINFIIMAFVVFLMVRWINKLKKPEPVTAPTTKECPYCKTQINITASKCPNCTSDMPQ